MAPVLTWEAFDAQLQVYFHVVILDMKFGKVLCQFDHNWKTCWLDAAHVRSTDSPKDVDSGHLGPGQTVEVHVQKLEQPLGWCKATIKSIKNSVACVQFLHSNDCVLVELQEMRQPNVQPCLDLSRYKKMEMTLPEHITFTRASSGDHEEFISVLPSVRERCSLVAISYRPSNHQIVVIGDDNALEVSRPVIDMAVAQRGQLQQMRQTTDGLKIELSRITSKERTREKVSDSKLDCKPTTVEEFKLHPSLIGAVIGRGGNRINKIQSLPGIVKINIDAETATVSIVGDSKANVYRAREKLELVESRISIEENFLEAAHEIVKAVESRSHLQRIRFDQRVDAARSSLSIVITGKKAQVNWAVNHIRRELGI